MSAGPRVRPVARRLLDALRSDRWPPYAALIAFGIDNEEHFAALQVALKPILEGGEPAALAQLDAVLGDGPLITAWVRRAVPSAPAYVTAYDRPVVARAEARPLHRPGATSHKTHRAAAARRRRHP
jgi:hypothetical protein